MFPKKEQMNSSSSLMAWFVALQCLALLGTSNDAFSASSIGNAGSVTEAYVDEMKNHVVKVSQDFAASLKEDKDLAKDKCNISALNEDQKRVCEEYIKFAIVEYPKLLLENPRVEAAVVTDDLIVRDEKVDAYCESIERDVPIKFSEKKIFKYTPKQILFLWFHELGHKVIFKDKPINDLEEFWPFKHGDELLDITAKILSEYATKDPNFRDRFTLLDFFQCSYKPFDDHPLATKFEYPALRAFSNHTYADYMFYFDTLHGPYFKMQFPDSGEKNIGEDIYLKMIGFDNDHCREGARRETIFRAVNSNDDTTIGEFREPVNILCGDIDATVHFGVSSITCKFDRTQGLAMAPLREVIQNIIDAMKIKKIQSRQ